MKENNRREKFIELAESRVNRAIKQLRLIGNLSNKGNYNYTSDDVNRIISALNDEIKALKSRFETSNHSDDKPFTLK